MLSSEESRPDGAGTSAVDVVPERAAAPLDAAVGPELASWGQRVVAALLDNAILAGVTWLALGTRFNEPTLTPGLGQVPGTGENDWPIGPLVLVPIGALTILLVLQALTGWTPGKLVVGIRVVRDRSDGQSVPAGLWTTLLRWVLHLLDSILLIGYLRPLWHQKRQTFADGFAHTVVVQDLPDLPRRPRIAVYSAALVVCVLGLGYGCVPISGSMSSEVDQALCELDSPGSLLTTGEVRTGGSVSVDRDRRMWTVKETRTAYPGATISWASDPSVRDVDYRVELEARPDSETGTPVLSRTWDIGTGSVDGQPDGWTDGMDGSDNSGDTDAGQFSHTRNVSPDGDVHVAEVEITGDDGATADLGTNLWIDVRLIADGEVLASCGGQATYDAADRGTP